MNTLMLVMNRVTSMIYQVSSIYPLIYNYLDEINFRQQLISNDQDLQLTKH